MFGTPAITRTLGIALIPKFLFKSLVDHCSLPAVQSSYSQQVLYLCSKTLRKHLQDKTMERINSVSLMSAEAANGS